MGFKAILQFIGDAYKLVSTFLSSTAFTVGTASITWGTVINSAVIFGGAALSVMTSKKAGDFGSMSATYSGVLQTQTNQNRESNNAEKQEIENAEPQQESSTNTQTASVINDAVSSMNESKTNNVVVSNENADTSQTRSDSIPPQN